LDDLLAGIRMDERGIDPLDVARGYQRLGLELALLEEPGSTRRASVAEVHAAAAAEPGRFVNIVLESPGQAQAQAAQPTG
jgi:hypothetical protein